MKRKIYHFRIRAPDFKKLSKKTVSILTAFLVLVAFVSIYFISKAHAGWYDSTWGYRKAFTVTNNGSSQSNFVVEITANTQSLIAASKLQSNCNDIRFTSSDGTTLVDFFTDYCSNTSGVNSSFFVEVPSISANSTTTVYMYYGNGGASSASSYANTGSGRPDGIWVGTGRDGSVSISSDQNINTAHIGSASFSCSDGGDGVNYRVTENRASGTNQIVTSTDPAAGCLNAGDQILIINQSGTNAGQYEFARLTANESGGTLTLNHNLTNGYNGTADKIMVQRVPNYTDVTISTAGTDLTPTAWDGNKGGVVAFRANGTVTVNSSTTINANSAGFSTTNSAPTSGTITGLGGGSGGGGGGGGGNATAGGGGGGGGGGQGGSYGTAAAAPDGGGGGGGGLNKTASQSRNGAGGSGGNGTPTAGGNAQQSNTIGGAGGGGGGGAGSSTATGGTAGTLIGTGTNGGTGGNRTGGTAGQAGNGGAGIISGSVNNGTAGILGTSFGSSSLSTIFLGPNGGKGGSGANGGGASSPNGIGGSGATTGGTGGGMVLIGATTLTVSGNVQANGGAGNNGTAGAAGNAATMAGGGGGGGSGGGAGGSVLLKAQSATLGSSLVTSTGGAGGTKGNGGDAGTASTNFIQGVGGTTSGAAGGCGTMGAGGTCTTPVSSTSTGSAAGGGGAGGSGSTGGSGIIRVDAGNSSHGTTSPTAGSDNIYPYVGITGNEETYASYAANHTGASPSLYWKLDEGTGTTTKNSMGTSLTGSLVSGLVGGIGGSGTNGGPVKIDDASNFGALGGNSPQIVRTSNGTLYTFLNSSTTCSLWSSSNGTSWTEKDSAHHPTCISGSYVALAVDSSDTLHMVYQRSSSVFYNTFNTSTNLYGTEETAGSTATAVAEPVAIAVDSNNVPHIANGWFTTITVHGADYENRVAGTWNTAVGLIGTTGTASNIDLVIDKDNIPEISLYEGSNQDILAFVGNANNATSFTSQNIDTTPQTTTGTQGNAIAIDSSGNTWVTYIDENGASDYVTIIEHLYGDAWSTWQASSNNTTVGLEPTIAISGTTKYIFFQDANADIGYMTYNGAWSSETVLQTGTYQDTKAKSSYLYNNYGTNTIDYLYSDATDVYWASLGIGSVSVGGSPPTWQSEDLCYSGKCLYFDGANDNTVSTADDATLDFAAADKFTVSAWVRNGTTSATHYILAKADAGYTGYKLYQDSSGNYCFDVKDGTNTDSACSSSTRYDDNKWHLVEGVKDGTSSLKVYVDGVLKATDSSIAATGTLANSGTFYVGADRDGTTNEWKGFIDEVKVFSGVNVRSADQIKQDYITQSQAKGASGILGSVSQKYLSDGLAGYWKMNETSGNLTDYSGNSLTLYNNNSATFTTGKFGNAANLSRSSAQSFLTETASPLALTGDMTLSAWIKPGANSASTQYDILGKWADTNTNYLLVQYGTELRMFLNSSSNYVTSTNANLQTNTWYHIAVVYTASSQSIDLYLNGSKLTTSVTGSIPSSINSSSAMFTIGGDTGASPYLYSYHNGSYEFISDILGGLTEPKEEGETVTGLTGRTTVIDGKIQLKLTEELNETAKVNSIHLLVDGKKEIPLTSMVENGQEIDKQILSKKDSEYLTLKQGDMYLLEFAVPDHFTTMDFIADGYYLPKHQTEQNLLTGLTPAILNKLGDQTVIWSQEANKGSIATKAYSAEVENTNLHVRDAEEAIALRPVGIGFDQTITKPAVQQEKFIKKDIDDGVVVTYPSVFGKGVNLEYTFTKSQVIKDIVIDSLSSLGPIPKSAQNLEMVFSLNTDQPITIHGEKWNGEDIVVSEGIAIGHHMLIPQPKATGNNGVIKPVQLHLWREGNKIFIAKRIPLTWLIKQTFPLRADIVITLDGETTYESGTAIFCSVAALEGDKSSKKGQIAISK